MEEKNLRFTGLSANTSDFDCNDEDLAISYNMISENGAMRPVLLPEPEFTLQEGEILKYIHYTQSYKNYIYINGNFIKAFRFEEGNRTDLSFGYSMSEGEELKKVDSVGNTLIIVTTKRMSYLLFKDGNYEYLGEKPPFLPISFGLDGEFVLTDKEAMENPDRLKEGENGYVFTEANKEYINSFLKAKISMFIKENSIDKNRFMYPFFIRYAYRLYDGSLYMHSSPILMIPSSGITPFALFSIIDGKYNYQLSAITSKIDYAIQNINPQLARWGDIIKSIDVFISEPIYTYDYNGEISGGEIVDVNNYPDFSLCKLDFIYPNEYVKYSYYEVLSAYLNEVNIPSGRYILPKLSINDKIRGTSLFYKISSLNFSEITTSARKELPIDEYALNTLQVREQMNDEYMSHDTLIPEYTYSYNSRLNIANLKRSLFDGFPLSSMVNFSEGKFAEAEVSYSFQVNVFIKEGDKEIVVSSSDVISLSDNIFFLYYPNTNAYRAVISKYLYLGETQYATVQLTPHSLLNGSFYFDAFSTLSWSATKPNFEVSADKTVQMPNKLFTSEVNNPFYFPLAGINTIGIGTIKGITSTTRAISQGQFGQFPLLVFSTDGIWAMEVSAEGLYSTRQPMSRDICSLPESITQLDGAIVFISEKGVMMLTTDEASPISTVLDGPSIIPDNIKKLSDIAAMESMMEIMEQVPFEEYIKNARIAYDYPNSRLYVSNPEKPYFYVYMSDNWATAKGQITGITVDYPDSYLQMADNSVIRLSDKTDFTDTRQQKGLILTRAIKLGDDMLKTVNTLIARGSLPKTAISMVLYASVDGVFFFPIGSVIGNHLSRLCGTPYKYFRILAVTNLNRQQSLSAISVYFTPKWRNKPR